MVRGAGAGGGERGGVGVRLEHRPAQAPSAPPQHWLLFPSQLAAPPLRRAPAPRLEQEVGIPLASEAETSKLFPVSNSAREVRDKLVAACLRAGVTIRYSASLEGLLPLGQRTGGESSGEGDGGEGAAGVAGAEQQQERAASHAAASTSAPRGASDGGGWRCVLRDGSTLDAARLVLATGGLSFPAVGTTGTGQELLRGLGIDLVGTYPALTPLLGQHPGGEQMPGAWGAGWCGG